MFLTFIGCFSSWHTEVEICDYLELAGHKVDRFHFSSLDLEKFKDRAGRYDMVITSLPQVFPPDFWREVSKSGPSLIAWYFDWIKNYHGRDKDYLLRLKEFDLILSTDGFENNVYQGLNRQWLPHACDPKVYFPVEGKQFYDAGFIGHVYSPYRKKLIEGLIKKYNFASMGLNDNCWGPVYALSCSQVKIMVGDNMRNDIPGYWSDRLYLSLACGAFLLYPRVGGIERYFTDGEHLVLYDSVDDLYKKIDYWLPREDERRRIALDGSAHARLNHSWQIRVKEFDAICDWAL